MVQRKLPSKLGIQADFVKTEKRLVNLKPSSQHQEGKNRGADLKKQMKKSRSMKHSDVESLSSSSPLRSCIPQPGKPPPSDIPMTAATPKRPNYMKSTSCFNARKERSQVSSQTGSDSKRNSSKPAKVVRKTSNLKPVRILTKTPSFKSARSLVNEQRETCSSTQKDSKFPPYLKLYPGATESEGPSVIKVCHFNYCSLNGDHRDPLPPLKCFLKEKRSSLKTQKSMKLEALTKRRAKPSGNKTNQIDNEDVLFDEKPAYKEGDACVDFFIKIYADNREDGVEAIARCVQGREEDVSPFGAGLEETEVDDDTQVTKSLSVESPLSEIDAKDKFEAYNEIAAEMDVTDKYSGEEHKEEDIDEEYPSSCAEEDATPGSFCSGIDFEGGECGGSIEYDTESEATNIEWEEAQFSSSELDIEANYSVKTEDGFDYNIECFSKLKNPDLQDEPVIMSYDIMSNCYEEILDDDVMQEVFEEESGFSERQSNDGGESELDVTHQILGTRGSAQIFDILSNDQFSCTEEACEDSPTIAEKGGKAETELIGFVITSASTEEPILEPTPAAEEAEVNSIDPDVQNDISEMNREANCTSEASDEPFNTHQVNRSQDEDDASAWLFEVVCIASQGLTGSYPVQTNEQNGAQTIEESETDQIVGISNFSLEQDLPNDNAGEVKEEEDCQVSEDITETELIAFVMTSASTEEPILETTAATEEAAVYIRDPEVQNEISEIIREANCTSEASDEPLNTNQENKSLQDEDGASAWLVEIVCIASQGFTKSFQVEANEQQNGIQKIEESETEQLVGISDFSLEQDLRNDDAGEVMEEKDCQVSEYKTETELIEFSITSASTEEPILEPTPATEEAEVNIRDPDVQNKISEMNLEANSPYEASNEPLNIHQESIDESPSAVTSVLSTDVSLEQDLPNDDAANETEEQDCQVSEAKLLVEIQISQDFSEVEQVGINVDDSESHRTLDARQLNNNAEDSRNPSQESIDESLSAVTENHLSGGQCKSMIVVEDESFSKTGQGEPEKSKISSSMDSDQSDSKAKSLSSGENCIEEVDSVEMEDKTDTNVADALVLSSDETSQEFKYTSFNSGNMPNQELLDACNNRKWTIGCRKPINDCDEERDFNPREPNYLPVVPDPEAEKIDLRHQEMDDRKDAEEWMLDFALQRAVNKLAPARKRKVALLVEAFETVAPTRKYEPRTRHTSAAFTHSRPIQACS